MSVQNVIDACDDASIERRDYLKALRFRWLSHALNNATFEPDNIIVWILEMREADESKLPVLHS